MPSPSRRGVLALVALLALAALPGVKFAAIESTGGLASIAMLESGEADLALLSNHVRGASPLRLITPLYEETLQVVVRHAT